MWRLAAIVLALLGTTRVAHADGPTVRLDAVGDAQACALDEVRVLVADLLARDPFAEDADVVVQVASTTTPLGVQATLTTRDGATRVLAAADCEVLATSVAVSVILLLEAGPTTRVEERQALDDEPLPTIEMRVVSAPRRARRHLVAELLVGGAGAISSRGAEAQLLFGGRVRHGRWSLGLELALAPADELAISPTERVRVTTTPLTLTPCAHVGPLALCAALTAGWTHGTGAGLVDASSASHPLAAAGARVAWERRVSSRLAVHAYAEAALPLATTRYLVDEMPVWTTPAYEARVGIGVVAQIP